MEQFFNINQHFKNDNKKWRPIFGAFVADKGCGKTSAMLQMAINIQHRFTHRYLISLEENIQDFMQKNRLYGTLPFAFSNNNIQYYSDKHLLEICDFILDTAHEPENSYLLLIDQVNILQFQNKQSWIRILHNFRKFNVTIILTLGSPFELLQRFRDDLTFFCLGKSCIVRISNYFYEEFYSDIFDSKFQFASFYSNNCRDNQFIVTTNFTTQIYIYSTQKNQEKISNQVRIIVRFMKSCKFRKFKIWLNDLSTIQWIYSPNQVGFTYAAKHFGKLLSNLGHVRI